MGNDLAFMNSEIRSNPASPCVDAKAASPEDDRLISGAVAHRNIPHNGLVRRPMMLNNFFQCLPERVIDRLSVGPGIVVKIIKRSHQQAMGPIQHARQPQSQQHAINVVQVLVQILEQKPCTIPGWDVGRAEQAVNHRQIASENRGSLICRVPGIGLRHQSPKAFAVRVGSMSKGVGDRPVQRCHALALRPTVQGRHIAESRDPFGVPAERRRVEQWQHPPTPVATAHRPDRPDLRVVESLIQHSGTVRVFPAKLPRTRRQLRRHHRRKSRGFYPRSSALNLFLRHESCGRSKEYPVTGTEGNRQLMGFRIHSAQDGSGRGKSPKFDALLRGSMNVNAAYRHPKRLMMTSALPYANGQIHIGHVAGAYLPGDIRARFERMAGSDVVWVCGSDEHGAAITLRAKKDGVTPREIVDRYHAEMQTAFAGLDMSFDHYSRTSSDRHHGVAQDFFLTLLKKGSFEVKTEAQFYDPEADQFLADRYITGTCPKCEAAGAYGDQCEKCGTALSPTDLINPTSTLSGATPVLKDTTLWYLPMGRHEGWLKTYIEDGILDGVAHHDAASWKSHVTGQCRSWIDSGLQSRAMTRDLDWGVPVPVEGADGKVLYVWLDAPIGYITSTMEWAERHGQRWQDWWQSDDTELVHFIGKDNIVFHCLIFPILLKEHGDYILPTNVPANAFMNLEGDKISTSRNWAVWVNEYLAEFPGKSDELRYVLASIMPEQKDSEFTWADYRDRVNNELADVLGNFVNRVVVLTGKYFDGCVPAASPEHLTDAETAVFEALASAPERIANFIRRNRFRDALQEAMGLARLGNKYMTEQEPWKVHKTDAVRSAVILNTCSQVVANCAVVLEPFLPRTAKTLQGACGMEQATWESARPDMIPAGQRLESLPILFEKIDEATVEAQVAKLTTARSAALGGRTECEPLKDLMTFEDFQKLDLRVGEVVACERVPKADKLLQLTIRTGLDERTVLSGIAEHFAPEDVVGRRVTLLANLAPRKIRGIESQGMVLMAETAEGELRFVTPEEGTQAGDVIR